MSKVILFCLGWDTNVSEDLLNILKRKERIILVFPHTSYFDFFIMLLYSFLYKESFKHEVLTLMQPGIFKYPLIGKYLRKLGCIPAGSIHEKGNTYDSIKEEINSHDRFLFLMSPKGRRIKGEWRNGYYHLAKDLLIPILPIGLNYCTHRIEFGDYFIQVDDYPKRIIDLKPDETQTMAISVMKGITPLHPERSEFKLDPYDIPERGLMSMNRLLSLMLILASITIIYFRFIYLTLLIITIITWRFIRHY